MLQVQVLYRFVGRREGGAVFFVYCLVSAKVRQVYVGFTNSPTRRLSEHNDGEVKATANGRPYRMIVLRKVERRDHARRSEKYFKSGFGKSQIRRLLILEAQRGCLTVDAESEGLLANPFRPAFDKK